MKPSRREKLEGLRPFQPDNSTAIGFWGRDTPKTKSSGRSATRDNEIFGVRGTQVKCFKPRNGKKANRAADFRGAFFYAVGGGVGKRGGMATAGCR